MPATRRRARPSGTPAARWLRRLLFAWAGWILLTTLVLNQPLWEGWINRKPERFQLHWDFALSLLPGHVMAWGVDLRGHARRQAWGIHARRASAWIVPWRLLQRDIVLRRVRGTGMAAVVRRGSVTLPPPLPREHPWTLYLSDLQANDVWSVVLGEQLALTGLGRVGGDLRKEMAGGELELGNGRMHWQQTRLTLLGARYLDGGSMASTFSMAPIAPSNSTGLQQFQALAVALDLDARVAPLALDEDGLRLDPTSGQRGHLAGTLQLRHGALDPRTRLALRQPVLLTVDGRDDAREFSADLGLEAGRLLLQAALPEGTRKTSVIAVDLSLPLPDASALAASGVPEAMTLPRLLLDGTSGSIDLSLRFKSLTLLRPWLARWKGLEASGEGWAHLSARLQDGRVLPESTLEFEDARLRLAALGHVVVARMHGPLQPLEGSAQVRRLTLQQVELRAPDGELLLSDAGATLDVVPPPGADDLATPPGLDFRMDKAAIPDLTVFNRYLPTGAIAFGQGAATLSLQLAVDPADRHARGRFALDSPSAQVHLADMKLRGEVALESQLHEADLDQRTLVLTDTRLALGKVAYDEPGGRNVRNWRLDAHLPRADATLATPLALDGAGTVRMSDLRLLLAVYSHISDYPMWVLKLADAGQVDAKARFRFEDGEFRLDDVHASNDRYTVQARMRLADGRKRGALLAMWGPLSVGVGLGDGDGKSRMRFRGARAWFDAQE